MKNKCVDAKYSDTRAVRWSQSCPSSTLLGPGTDLVAHVECGLWGWLADVDPRRGSRLCRSRRRRVSGERVCIRTTRWHATTSEGESRTARNRPQRSGGRIARGKELFNRCRAGCGVAPAKTGHCEWPSALSGRAMRGGERRNTAVSGHRIHVVRLGKPSEPVRARRLRSLGARVLGGSSVW